MIIKIVDQHLELDMIYILLTNAKIRMVVIVILVLIMRLKLMNFLEKKILWLKIMKFIQLYLLNFNIF